MINHVAQQCGGQRSEDDVVGIHEKICHVCPAFVDEQRAVGAGHSEAHGEEVVAEPQESRPWRLLDSIERLDKQANMVGVFFVDEAGGLMAVDAFGKFAVEECILDVELVHRPSSNGGEVEHSADRRWFDNR